MNRVWIHHIEKGEEEKTNHKVKSTVKIAMCAYIQQQQKYDL